MKTAAKHICHLSSVHFALDTRIFYRFCTSLQKNYQVTLIACHQKKEVKNGILIIPFKRYTNRHLRIFTSWFLMFPKALATGAKVFHLHDPELIPCGMLLKIFGKKVIFDIHENIAEDIFEKPWIKNQKVAYNIFQFFEFWACKFMTIILAEKSYEKRYLQRAPNAVTILNYCDINFFRKYRSDKTDKLQHLYYIGIILESRGLLEIIESIYFLKQRGKLFHFHIVGELYSDLKRKITGLSYYSEIKEQLHFYGRKNLEEGYAISVNCGIGMCIIHPLKNAMESYPTKIFEYMACGMPIIASDFELYKETVENNHCGICVSPLDTKAIAKAIEQIAENPELAKSMGEAGKAIVDRKYNWETEEQKLQKLYSTLFNDWKTSYYIKNIK